MGLVAGFTPGSKNVVLKLGLQDLDVASHLHAERLLQ